MEPRTAALLALALVTTGLAGCIGSTDDSATPTDDPASEIRSEAYVPLNTSALSQPTHEMLPRATERVTASIGGIDLFVEYWLPDGEGPFPTILHSTPYSHLDRSTQTVNQAVSGEPGGNQAFFVPRGYAYVVADVRGFGESEGCVEVWGPGEQQDQVDLVEWIAQQPWSDGTVGMIGASYPGTTPIEAAIQDPEPLKAIVATAGLTDPYYDWHFGGVPNGESGPAGSPAAYQGIGTVVPMEPTHGLDWVQSVADSGCETPQLVLDAYQSDGTYNEFYAARNFSAHADQVDTAVLYTQGFDDGNVKPSQLLNWFNALDSPKKGIFGHWGHQYPPRADWTNLSLAWFDEHLKNRDTNVMMGPSVEVHTNLDTWRSDVAFPSNRTHPRALFPTTSGTLSWSPGNGGTLTLETGRADATVASNTASATGEEEQIVLRSDPLEEALYVTGQIRFAMNVSLEGAENAFLHADLNAVTNDTSTQVSFGELNLALRNGVRAYEPMPQAEPVDATLRFQPVEYIFEAGTVVELVVEPIDLASSDTYEAAASSTLTIHTGDTGTALKLPALDGRPDVERPDDV